MLKFITAIMDWWWDRPPGDDRHDFVEPPVITSKEQLDRLIDEANERIVETGRYGAKSIVAAVDPAHPETIVLKQRPTLEEALEVVKEFYHVHSKAEGTFQGEHRGRSFTAAPSSADAALMQPPNLKAIVQQLKALGAPFLVVCLHREAIWSGAVHGWCNGSNFGRQVIEELTRCAELNIKQELAKCGEFGAGRQSYSGPPGYMEGSGPKPTKYLK